MMISTAYGFGGSVDRTNKGRRLASARTLEPASARMITDPAPIRESWQGVIDLANRGYFQAGSKVLYAHLGGAPTLNGYAYALRNR
jgi:1-aminocyclopropane-1-carboxylate deaminase/D-cysteine desulfhydrase-like pyridoxal-dependent ACC family enzyme